MEVVPNYHISRRQQHANRMSVLEKSTSQISIMDSLNLDGGKDRIVDSRLARHSVPQPVQGVATVGLSRGKES